MKYLPLEFKQTTNQSTFYSQVLTACTIGNVWNLSNKKGSSNYMCSIALGKIFDIHSRQALEIFRFSVSNRWEKKVYNQIDSKAIKTCMVSIWNYK